MPVRISQFNRLAIAGAAFSAAAVLLPAAQAFGALTAYQTVVVSDSPYEFYRFGENPVNTGTPATDTSGNGRTGSYPVGATGGQFAPGDSAVLFNGASQYLIAGPSTTFGSIAGTSSYEFVYKVNPGYNQFAGQSLFGVFNSGTGMAISINLSAGANGAQSSNSVQMFIRDNIGDSVGAAFINNSLFNGGYHHLVFTFDGSAVGANAFRGYVDGSPQTLTFQPITDGNTDGNFDPNVFANFSVNPAYAARNANGAFGNFANVTLDEAAIYSSVLSPTQVSTHAAVPEPATVGLAMLAGTGLLMRRRRTSR